MSMLFLDQKCPVLSNGAHVFGVSLILCAGKWIQLCYATMLAFNLNFQHLGINLQENQVHRSKERKILV